MEGYRVLFKQAKEEAACQDSAFHGKIQAAFYYLVCQRQDKLLHHVEELVRSLQPILTEHTHDELGDVQKGLHGLLGYVSQSSISPHDPKARGL